ncbi:hypothetical protein PSQ40_05860 [Curvibacter sp. HBC61]|uniref:ABC transporter permease n=1 Tax=Curvibacter cyanobacteriorum TaxID=3026422 RepID=A0ABT5MXC4_9BURK|nr:hypothetical protein [Curvibacter sp. HBC61]MDD0838091.1 hypothetical protein [Curvibacter sp. HBC61]
MKLPAQPPFSESELTPAIATGVRPSKSRITKRWSMLRWGGLALAILILLEPYWS